MKPSIGRIVHFRASCGDEGPYAGIVTQVHGDGTTVDLVTFGPSSMYHNRSVPFAEQPTEGCWSWPPRT